MSFVSANDHPDPVSPQDPLYYAPRSVRTGVAEPRSSVLQQAPSGNLPSDPRFSRFDDMREEAFAKFARPLESQFVDERRRSRGLLATVGAVALAIGATATLAYVVFTASPQSKSEPAETAVSIAAPALATPALATPALVTPTQAAPPSGESQALLEGFKQFRTESSEEAAAGPFAAAAAKEKEATKESQILLDKFMQWQPRK